METKDIYYVAGILEGEGHFSIANGTNPRIFLKMTDYDIVDKIRQYINPNISIGSAIREIGNKRIYTVAFNGHHAIGWMMMLYPLMSARRKEQIGNILTVWKQAKSHNGFTTATGKALIRAIARKHFIPEYEAHLRLNSGKFVTGSDGKTYIGF